MLYSCHDGVLTPNIFYFHICGAGLMQKEYPMGCVHTVHRPFRKLPEGVPHAEKLYIVSIWRETWSRMGFKMIRTVEMSSPRGSVQHTHRKNRVFDARK